MEFIGNQKIITRLEAALAKGKTAQAYLFAGPANLGKHMLAEFFALALIEGTIELEWGKTVSSNARMDMLELAPRIEEKKGVVKQKKISVEEVRGELAKLALYPQAGKKKVLIIDEAHKMSTGAQNALLKTLEEPNPTSVLILVTSEEENILPTLKSRCQKVTFNLLLDEELEKMLGGTEGEAALRLAFGRPGLVQKMLADGDFLLERKRLAEKMQNVFVLSLGEKFNLADELSKNVNKAIEALTMLVWFLRKKAHNEKEKMQEYFVLIAKIQESVETLKLTNANAKMILENLFVSI